MNQLIKTDSNELDMMSDIDKFQTMSKKLMQTKHYQKMGEDGIFAICIAAKSNGISVNDALNGELYYVQGKVGMGYEAMNKYIRMAGHSVIIKHLDDKSCTLVGKRKDTGDTAEITYDTMDAKRAGKNYDKHPKVMLFARCLSMLKRFLFPDVLTKIYEKGELEDIREDHKHEIFETTSIENTPIEIKTISVRQYNELNDLLNKCSQEVKTNFTEYCLGKFKIQDLSRFPEKEFEKNRDILMKRSDEYQKKLTQQEAITIEKDEQIEIEKKEEGEIEHE